MPFTRIPAGSLLVMLALAGPSFALGGKAIDPNYLSITDCPGDPGCAALVLLDERELTHKAGYSVYRVRNIIKIFTNEGVAKYADAEIPWTRQGRWLLDDLSGRTILPSGSAIPLKRDNIREKPLKVGRSTVWSRTIAFSGVIPGSIVEYTYELNTSHGILMPLVTWELQRPIPVLKARFKVNPGSLPVGWARTGIDRPDFREPDGVTVVELSAENVRAIPDEPATHSGEALRTRFYFYLDGLEYRWIRSLAGRTAGEAGKFLEGGAAMTAKVKDLVSPADPPRTKVETIYRFVQQEIGSDEERSGQSSETAVKDAANAAEVLSRGFGNEVERTLLFLALVKEAGLTPGLLLIESRQRGILNVQAPDETQFDSLGAAVKLDDQWTFYDPGLRHCPFGFLSPDKAGEQVNAILVMPDKSAGAETVVNMQGILVKMNEEAPFTTVTIPIMPASKSVLLRQASLKLGTDGVLEGEVTEHGSGLVDLAIRRGLDDEEPAQRPELLRARVAAILPGAEITGLTLEDLESFEKPATIRYQVRVPAVTAPAGDRLIVTPSLFASTAPNPFTKTTRVAPVYFSQAQSTQDRIHLSLPEGYAIESLPLPSRIQEGPFILSTAFTEDEDGIEFLRVMVIDAAAWPARDYLRLKTFFERVQQADRQVVVLRKEPAS